MKSKKLLNFISALSLIFGLTVFVHDISAAQAKKEIPVAQENKEDKILEKVSKEGRDALQGLRWARIAIFDGQLQQAKDMLEQSKKLLSLAEQQVPALVVTVAATEMVDGKAVNSEKATVTNDLIPIDASLVLAEDFVATPEKSEKIKTANEHLKKQETSKAVAVLREADVAVSVSRVLMPVKDTIKHVDKAIEQLGEHKYYEANLSLKAAEDGLIVDSVSLYEPVVSSKK